MRKWLRKWLGIEDLSVAVVNDGLLISRVDGNLTSAYKTIGVIDAAVVSVRMQNAADLREVQKTLAGEVATLSNKVDSRHADSVAMYEVAKQNVQKVRTDLDVTERAEDERFRKLRIRVASIEENLRKITDEQSAHLSALSVILPRARDITAADTIERCAILVETIALPHFRESHRKALAKLIRESANSTVPESACQ